MAKIAHRVKFIRARLCYNQTNPLPAGQLERFPAPQPSLPPGLSDAGDDAPQKAVGLSHARPSERMEADDADGAPPTRAAGRSST